ncbi:hypothetical protein ACNOIU_15310 [Exiguobacterium mexicanum]|uniref:Uncharacterized protein n=1 Tax=Exiguobacterium mexicanum TaxID=340146 RepID=A0ABT7MNQ0_9BACL|nr:hypothetical protein [Exiguobacterium mexicanum]MDL5376806.1 hypothetical protein [Exiguobacterium mexicanum]
MITLYDISRKIVSSEITADYEEFLFEEIHQSHAKAFKDLIKYMGIPYRVFKIHTVKREKFQFQDASVPHVKYLIQNHTHIKKAIQEAYKNKDIEEFKKQTKPIMDFLSVEFKEHPTNLEQCRRCIQYKFRLEEACLSDDVLTLLKNTTTIHPFDEPVLYGWYLNELDHLNHRLKLLRDQVEEYRKDELNDINQAINDKAGEEKLLITKHDAEEFINCYRDGITNDFKIELTIALVYKLSKANREKTEEELIELAYSISEEYNAPTRQKYEKNYAKYNTVPGLAEYMEKVINSLEAWKKREFKGRNQFFELLHEIDHERENTTFSADIELFDYMSSLELIRYLQKREEELVFET